DTLMYKRSVVYLSSCSVTTLSNFRSCFTIAEGTCRLRVIRQNALLETWSFRNTYIAWNDSIKNFFRKVLSNLVSYLHREVRSPVVHRQKNGGYNQFVVE